MIGIVTALLAAILCGSLMKEKGEIMMLMPLLMIALAFSQGPVSLAREYWIEEMVSALSPRLLKMTVWLTPPACCPVMTPFHATVTGLTDNSAAWLWPVPFSCIGVLIL